MATGSDHEGRKLCDLRVVDLRSELEKRGLDKAGVKITLVERLQQVIIEEGHDPEEYVFDNKGPSQRLSTSSKQDDMESMDADNSQEQDSALDVDLEDLLVKDEIIDESLNDEEETEGPNMRCDEKVVNVKDVKPLKVVEIKVANCRAVAKSRPGPASAKRKAAAAAAAIAVSPIATESNAGENEDSINLTIGEDEEKLLQEEDMGGAAKKVKIDETMLQETSVDDLDKTELLDNCVEEEPVEDNPQSTTTGKSTTQESANSLKNEDTKNEPAADVSSTSEDIAASATTAPGKGISKDDKDASAKQSAVNSQASRNLWVSGLATSTRATDLKQVFSKHGKVIGAKVVTNAKAPGSRCYGYITMATSEDASKCIQRLNRTELHGRIISLEKAKSDATNPPKKSENVTGKKSDDKKIAKEVSTKKESEKKSVEKVVEVKTDPVEKLNESNGPVKTSESEKKVESLGNKEKEEETGKNKPVSVTDKSETKKNSKSQNREKSPIRGKKRQPRINRERQKDKKMEVLSFNKIREERERQRLRERQRALREEERRGREELARAREMERRQREEAQRLAREREKLQTEREKIEREKAALMRAERERQKMERERLEYEKMELKRQQIKIEEAHRAALKRPVADRRMDNYVDDRKRLAVPERRFEAPPPPRFDSTITGRSAYEPEISNKKDFKRDDFKRSGADDFKRDSFKRGGADDFKRPDFKRDFDIAPRNTAPANHSSHAVNQGGTSGGSKMMKYPSPAYDSRRDTRDTGRHAMDVTPTRREGGPMASLVVPRGKDSRYPVRGAERTTERGGTGAGSQPFRGGRGDDRDTRHVEPEHRSGKVDPRGSGPTRDRYVDSSKGRADSGRYADRSASSWHGGSSSGVKPFGSTNSSGTAPGGGSGVRGDNWNKPVDPWRQIDSGSNDRWSGGPLYPPGVTPGISLSGRMSTPSSGSFMGHHYNMSSNVRKY